jgi:hypothetical protein
VPHRDAVANPDSVEDKGNAPGRANGVGDKLGDLFEVNVPRDDVDAAADDRDERAFEIFLRDASSAEKTAVRGAAGAFFN